MKETVTSNRIKVFAPASVSNLGPGFDVLGLALEHPGDVVEAELASAPGVEIVEVTGSQSLSTDPERNVAGIAARAVLDRAGPDPPGVRLWVHKQMPLASGLGSSAASSVAAAVAVNTLLEGRLSEDAVIAAALEGEAEVSGGAHADNVAPCARGGIVLVRSSNPLDLISLPVPEALRIAVVYPHIVVKTQEARRLLAEHRFHIQQVVTNLGNIGALVTALHRGDLELLGRSIGDALVEPIRAPLVPGLGEVKEAATAAGALGCSISGSGPSVFAFAGSDADAVSIAAAMQSTFERAGISSDRFVGRVSRRGGHVLAD